jgi:hypothetical protein
LQYDPSKRRNHLTKRHGVTLHKTVPINSAVRNYHDVKLVLCVDAH